MSGSKYAGNNRRGAITIPPRAHPLVRVFFARVNEEKTTFLEISDRTGVGIDTMRYWRSRHSPTLPTFEAALNGIDLELCIRDRATGRVLADPLKETRS